VKGISVGDQVVIIGGNRDYKVELKKAADMYRQAEDDVGGEVAK
jgi:hypothetical protein